MGYNYNLDMGVDAGDLEVTCLSVYTIVFTKSSMLGGTMQVLLNNTLDLSVAMAWIEENYEYPSGLPTVEPLKDGRFQIYEAVFEDGTAIFPPIIVQEYAVMNGKLFAGV